MVFGCTLSFSRLQLTDICFHNLNSQIKVNFTNVSKITYWSCVGDFDIIVFYLLFMEKFGNSEEDTQTISLF